MLEIKMVVRVTWLCLAVGVCGGIAIGQELSPETLRARLAVTYRNVPRKVLAFYYPWYGLASFSGQDRHYGKIDTDKHDIQTMTHYPTVGPFDSHDPKIVAYHMKLAKQAGVDGFISSWWGQGDFTDKAMPVILDEAQKAGVEVTVYVERVKPPVGPESAAEDLVYVAEKYGTHPAFLKVDGKPVIFVYIRAINDIGLTNWATAIELANAKLKTPVCAIGDRLSEMAATIFDGIHTYNVAGQCRDRAPEQSADAVGKLYAPAASAAAKYKRILALTVIPGYDDTKVRTPGLAVQRYDGKLYQALWDECMKLDPDWILITSWNEWHEGSEIEPSLELGDQYIKATRPLAERFKALPRTPRTEQAVSRFSEQEMAALRDALKGTTVGLLPNAGSPAVLWLLRSGIGLRAVTWRELVEQQLKASDVPVLVYAADEHYMQTINRAGDVDEALQGYLRSGGVLIALPGLPLPFFYGDNNQVVNNARRFGMPIAGSSPRNADPVQGGRPMGWETPPESLGKLYFEADTTFLPHVPARFEFPTGGDLRWRPWVAADVVGRRWNASLIKVKTERGRYLGEALAGATVADGEKGVAMYAWFRLLDGPYAEELLYDLFMLVSKRPWAKAQSAP